MFLDLCKQLGFLALTLQTAVATIQIGDRYTIETYLKRVSHDLEFMVAEKVLGEYEKPIKATLAISMEQIEKSDKLPADCKEICKSILNVAAYCDPSGIPQDLFLHLPNTTQELVLDAIHQLQSYSLFSRSTAKSKRDRTACVSIHRLLR